MLESRKQVEMGGMAGGRAWQMTSRPFQLFPFVSIEERVGRIVDDLTTLYLEPLYLRRNFDSLCVFDRYATE